MLDAVVVGSGPNGLAAAIALAQAGKSVLVIEGADTIGGGTRGAELTEPGVVHDVCSAVHPLGAGSPFLSSLPLADHGLEWAHPPIPFAHALEGGDSVLVFRSIDETAEGLGPDGPTWRRIFGPFVADWERTVRLATAPPLRASLTPVAGLRMARYALRSGTHFARRFRTERGRAVIAGMAAHSVTRLDAAAVGGLALVLGASAHAVGWPFAVGGSEAISGALGSHLESLGGRIETGHWVGSIDQVPPAKVVLFDTAPAAVTEAAGHRMSWLRRRRYDALRSGAGIFKVDIAASGPIPWSDDRLRGAGTVHVGGTLGEIADAEAQVAAGSHAERPFVLLAQPTAADATRAPAGTAVVWAYCHVPAGSTRDMTDPIIDQVERFAPGFRSTIRSISTMNSADYEAYNPNFRGGDITAGPVSLAGIIRRPTLMRPYRAGRGVYLCSAATPPGAGVHGMCGYHAAVAALREL